MQARADDSLDLDDDDRSTSTSLDNDTDGDGIINDDDSDTDGDDIDDLDDDNDGTADVDDDDHHGDHHGDQDEQKASVQLTATSSAPARSEVKVKYQKRATGEVSLKIDAEELPAGTYNVVVNSTVLGSIILTVDDGDTEDEAEFKTNPHEAGELPLPFDPALLPIEITKDGVTYFTGTVPAALGTDRNDD